MRSARGRTYVLHAALLAIALGFALISIKKGGEAFVEPAVLLPPQNPTYIAPPGGPAVSGIGSIDTTATQALTPASALSATEVGQDAPAGEPAPQPTPVAFLTHEVAEGDTLSSIGGRYGVGVDYLVWNNPEVGPDPDALAIGEKLLVPGTDGIVYDVRLGDTISDIAATYSVDPAEILSFSPNGLESPDVIREGMTLVLPGAVPPAPPPPAEELPPAEQPPIEQAPPAPAPPLVVPPEPVVTPTPPPVVQPAPAVAGFIWPVIGTLNSRFGPRWGGFHSGIDIGAASGTAVAASASGQVVLTVYGFGAGYGNYVIVRHGDGTETLYAHLSAIYVSVGQQVGQGEPIGAVGCTGWCTGPHLHFEVRIGAVPVDPLLYLP